VSSGRRRSPQAPPAPATIHQRHGDRCDPDQDVRRQLRRYVRYKDLVEAGIIGNWPTLLRFIEDEGFPPGIMIGPNTRAWPLDEVEAWLANRPTARKDVPLPRKQLGPRCAEVAAREPPGGRAEARQRES
jgi:predicted DNA-binding transcriptional regulator AlpA